MSGYTIDFRVGIVGSIEEADNYNKTWVHTTKSDLSISLPGPRRANDGD